MSSLELPSVCVHFLLCWHHRGDYPLILHSIVCGISNWSGEIDIKIEIYG